MRGKEIEQEKSGKSKEGEKNFDECLFVVCKPVPEEKCTLEPREVCEDVAKVIQEPIVTKMCKTVSVEECKEVLQHVCVEKEVDLHFFRGFAFYYRLLRMKGRANLIYHPLSFYKALCFLLQLSFFNAMFLQTKTYISNILGSKNCCNSGPEMPAAG